VEICGKKWFLLPTNGQKLLLIMLLNPDLQKISNLLAEEKTLEAKILTLPSIFRKISSKFLTSIVRLVRGKASLDRQL